MDERVRHASTELLRLSLVRRQAESTIHESSKEKDFSRASDMKKSATEALQEADRAISASSKTIEAGRSSIRCCDWFMQFESEISGHADESLVDVNLENCGMTYTALLEMMPLLKCRVIGDLILDGNGFGDDGAALIRTALSDGSLSVENLSLRNTSLTTDGAIAFVGMVAGLCGRLKTIDISCNGLANQETINTAIKAVRVFNKSVTIKA